jgi:hypothetical protein
METSLTLKRLKAIRNRAAILIFALLVCACSSTAASRDANSPGLSNALCRAKPQPTNPPVRFHRLHRLHFPNLHPKIFLDASTFPYSGCFRDPARVDLIAALRQGGYVIYFRHAETDQSQTDASPLNFQDCSTQRNLNEQGRAEARAIGVAFLTLGIPIDRVLTSKYCRTRETTLLAFGKQEDDP